MGRAPGVKTLCTSYKPQMIELEIYNTIDKITSTILVEQLDSNKYRMVDNDIVNGKLTKGTEFETKLNADGIYEMTRITKESDFITRQFRLSANHKESDYLMLAEELTKHGGYWQYDILGIVTINIPKDFKYDVDLIMKELNLELIELIDDGTN